MRSLVALALAAAACHPPPPAAPENEGDFALAPARAALPPYGGAVWSSPCSVRLGPASAGERAARIAAMQTWFPDATIELAALGDRARTIRMPGRGRGPTRHHEAEALAQRVARLAAPLFGVEPWSGSDRLDATKRAWFIGIKFHTHDFTRREGEEEIELVVRIDRESGEVRVGLVDDVFPRMPACQHEPTVDAAAIAGAVVGRRMSGDRNGAPLTADDLVVDRGVWPSPADDGRSSHGVVAVGVKRTRVVFDVEPTTLEVVGERYEQGFISDPAGATIDPRRDAARVFGRERHR